VVTAKAALLVNANPTNSSANVVSFIALSKPTALVGATSRMSAAGSHRKLAWITDA
jgi:hypothetical protein